MIRPGFRYVSGRFNFDERRDDCIFGPYRSMDLIRNFPLILKRIFSGLCAVYLRLVF